MMGHKWWHKLKFATTDVIYNKKITLQMKTQIEICNYGCDLQRVFTTKNYVVNEDTSWILLQRLWFTMSF
jgi:hypothetical protein